MKNKKVQNFSDRKISCLGLGVGTEELMLLNCGVGENSRFSWTARRSNQSVHETETPILWPLDMKSSLIGKYPDAVKD